MKILMAITFVFFSQRLLAQDMCAIDLATDTKTYALNNVPNYFFKMSPDGKKLYYISQGKNWLKDLSSGSESVIPGEADPVPSPEGDLLTYISRSPDWTWSIGATDLEEGKPVNTPVKNIANAGGSYQSVGPKDADGKRPFFYFDEIKEKLVVRSLMSKSGSFQLSEAQDVLLGSQYRLPMLSPDGKKFSVLNLDINKTQIFSLDPLTNKATLIDVLPVAGGKASFSYDGSKVTFHLTKSSGGSRDHKYPSLMTARGEYRNIYSYDLNSKKITQITDNVGSSSYFPIFLKDGRIAFLDKPVNTSVYSLKILTPVSKKNNTERNFDHVKDCFGEGAAEELMRLGNLWGKICKRWNSSLGDDTGIALTIGLNMTDANCREIASLEDDESLLLLCDALGGKKIKQKRPLVSRQRPQENNPGKKLFQNRCAICHEGNQELLKKSSSLDERIGGKKSNRMPPMGPLLSTAEVKLLKQYLSDFVQP